MPATQPQPVPSSAQATLSLLQAIELASTAYGGWDWTAAEQWCRLVLDAEPDYFDALNLLGVITAQTMRSREAADLLGRAVALRPDSAPALNNLGNALKDLGQLELAVAHYERAIAVRPEYKDAYACFNRGVVLEELGRLGAAVASYELAVAIKPDYADAHFNRGCVLYELRRLDESVASYEIAIAIKPDYAEAYYNRGIVFHDLKRLDAAVDSYDRAIAIKPDYPAAYWNKSQALLLGGDFEHGWKLYEWRWRYEKTGLRQRDFCRPLWLGAESLRGKTILLHGEQGLGDTLQFCRYAKLVAGLGAKVVLEVQAPLLALLSGTEGASVVLAKGSELPAFDFHCPLISLPLALKTELDSIPAGIPYIQSDPVRAAKWRERLGKKTRPRIGLVWSGGFRPDQPAVWDTNARRNIPFAKIAALKLPQLDFFSLQKGEPAESELAQQKQDVWPEANFHDYVGELKDFSDTAALIENLDLIISVDTSTAHLAGALGKPVWILNRFDSCWRWLLERDDSPWYPTAKLYRQERPGDWDGVLDRVKSDLGGMSATEFSNRMGSV